MIKSPPSWLAKVLISLCILLSSPAYASDQDDVDYYSLNLSRFIDRYKSSICPKIDIYFNNVCTTTQIAIDQDPVFDAYEMTDGNHSVIHVAVGVYGLIDEFGSAMILARYQAHNDNCAYIYLIKTLNLALRAASNGRESSELPSFLAFSLKENKLCKGVNWKTAQGVYNAHGVLLDQLEDGTLTFILLHELGHVVHQDGKHRATATLANRRAMETNADTFAINAASAADYPGLVYGMAPQLFSMLQGSDGHWEAEADHPLGVRRALIIYQQLREEWETHPQWAAKDDPHNNAMLSFIDGHIALLQNCLGIIERGKDQESCH